MELINTTPYKAAYGMGIRPNGSYCIVVAVKATFDFPAGEMELALAAEQVDLFDTDSFTAEPGLSSPVYENDYASHKPRCDVLIHAKAYAPQGKPVKKLTVSAEVGAMHKAFDVLGKRYWEKKGFSLSASEPESFTEQALNWEIAYGGIDETYHEDKEQVETYLQNPVGTGYWKKPETEAVKETPIAQTQALGQPIEQTDRTYAPQGLGAIGRNWHPRTQYAGTYDKQWEKQRKPFLPDDFDERYYQCAPEDQQIDYPQGGEEVTLINLSKEGRLAFRLPSLDIPIKIRKSAGSQQTPEAVIDTLTLDVEKRQLTLVARAQVELIHSIHEISRIEVGEPQSAEQAAPQAAVAPAHV